MFAIAITLLVLDISMPEADFHDLWRGFLNQWPSYLGYVTSFLTIGGIWPTTACSAGWDVASSVKP